MQSEIDGNTQVAEVSNSSILAALTAHERLCTFPRGGTIFEIGAEPDGVHVLLSGDVELAFQGPRGGSLPLRLQTVGTILGLSSIAGQRPHEYTAIAKTSVLTGYVDRDTLFRILHATPSLWFDVLQVLSRDISSCYARVKAMSSTRRNGGAHQEERGAV